MPAYLDCPGCSCLVAARDSSCPFCGAALRSAYSPAWLTLGFVAALGSLTISCGDKSDNDDDTVADSVSDSQGPDSNGDVSDSSNPTVGVTYAGPDESSVSDPGFSSSGDGPPDPTTSTTNDPSNGEGTTYAGPDETGSTETAPDTSTTSTGTDSDGTDGSDSSGDSESTSDNSSTGSSSTG